MGAPHFPQNLAMSVASLNYAGNHRRTEFDLCHRQGPIPDKRRSGHPHGNVRCRGEQHFTPGPCDRKTRNAHVSITIVLWLLENKNSMSIKYPNNESSSGRQNRFLYVRFGDNSVYPTAMSNSAVRKPVTMTRHPIPKPGSNEPKSNEPKGDRLQKILAQAGIASRRRAEEIILAGRVQVNGTVVNTLGTRHDATH